LSSSRRRGSITADVSEESDQRCASFCLVGGSGSRALLRSPGMTVLNWFTRSRLGFAVRDDAGGWGVKEPAPVGPQRVLRACEVIEGGASGSPARCVMVKVRARLLITRGLFQRTWSKARIGHPRLQGCEACGGTAPCPASATPRERAPRRERMHNDIAELRAKVKNKVRTFAPSPLPFSGRGWPAAAGRERGRAPPDVPSPGSLCSPPSPAEGGGKDPRLILHAIPDRLRRPG
jgi:hypothetical protein